MEEPRGSSCSMSWPKSFLFQVGCDLVDAGLGAGLVLVAARDRKSTRLNSSHTVISYAVLCLKKNKFRPHTVYHLWSSLSLSALLSALNPRRPIFLPFPYTTLFRSVVEPQRHSSKWRSREAPPVPCRGRSLSYFRSAATLSMPALAQASSLSPPEIGRAHV